MVNSYWHLHPYLSLADTHYLEGKVLWLHTAIDGACNLSWLAIEQIIKVLIIQKSIKKNTLKLPLDTGHCIKIHDRLKKVSKDLGLGHKLDPLLEKLNKDCNINLNNYYDTLNKVNQYYFRRYIENGNSSINMELYHKIDEIYFYLRDKIDENIPMALLDEIAIQKKFETGHPVPYFSYAHKNNQSFRSRKHPVVNYGIITTDGRNITIVVDGINDKIREY